MSTFAACERLLAVNVGCCTRLGLFITVAKNMLHRSASCAKHFKLLRTLVCHWLSDVMHNQSNEADTLLMNVYRWICTPTSALYEPALHSMLLSMMRKVRLQLFSG